MNRKEIEDEQDKQKTQSQKNLSPQLKTVQQFLNRHLSLTKIRFHGERHL